MTEQNQINQNDNQDEYDAINKKYDQKIMRRYKRKIKDGKLEIMDPEIINLRFLENFDIQYLRLYISNGMSVRLRNNTINKLTVLNLIDDSIFNLNDLELQNLEVLELENNGLQNNLLYNLFIFQKLHTLRVNNNKVDLTHIHNITNLTTLQMQKCGLKNIDQITSLVNLKDLDISSNRDLDLSPLYKVKGLSKLTMNNCCLTNIDQIVQLTNLEVLDISSNYLYAIDSIRLLVNLKELDISFISSIDITPLKDLTGLIKLNLQQCKLGQLAALKPLIKLQTLDLTYNQNISITDLQYFKNLIHLSLEGCRIVSIYILRALVNLEELNISRNKIVYIDANLDQMAKLKYLRVQFNQINDFSPIEKHLNKNDFDTDDQQIACEEVLHEANKHRNIERPNIKLKETQNKRKLLQTALNQFKQEINETMNNERQIQIQFTANVVRLFQFLNQFGFE
ncbi:leucine-rich_repeat domain-containing protein [Hexamita inflata]|uniref:Leucine-rich repeat domain-containing protein n=1 Tax=Hexamita inflata TaxID=28002 RepID=A0AA86P1J3_9EUKA|nr:leucine-rich repeat domain-containing protein [Hexamita inflata]